MNLVSYYYRSYKQKLRSRRSRSLALSLSLSLSFFNARNCFYGLSSTHTLAIVASEGKKGEHISFPEEEEEEEEGEEEENKHL